MRRTRAWTGGTRLAAAMICTLVALLAPATVHAQTVTGRIVGTVRDSSDGTPVAGVTVVTVGAQGEDSALTDDSGRYVLRALPVGRYSVRFYYGDAAVRAERDVIVAADQVVRADAQVAVGAPVDSVVVTLRAPAIDMGTARSALTLRQEFAINVPLGRTFGEVLDRVPGAFVDRSGNVSIGGASGIENVYVIDGLNVTGVEYGDIMNQRLGSSGGSNLVLEFVEEITVNTGGYNAEFGGAMGGLVNVVTRSGGNDFRGSAFSYLAPAFLSASPRQVTTTDTVLVGRHDLGLNTNIGVEVGGPLIRNRLFFWAGFAPRIESGHFSREVQARVDNDADGAPDVDGAGNPITTTVENIETAELRHSYPYGAKLTFVPRRLHRLNLGLFGTPSISETVHDRFTGRDAVADPRWALQGLRKVNTDAFANWTSQLFDRRWKIEAAVGLHRESLDDKSPHADLNERNQLEWRAASLFDLEGTPGCEPRMVGGTLFDPCPVDGYHSGGYGALRRYTGQRWALDLKSSHFFALLGAHEFKYGVQLALASLDLTRAYSGPAGNRALIQNAPGNTTITSLFTLPPGRYPFQFGDAAPGNPDPAMDGSPGDLTRPPLYQDALRAKVKSVTSAAFVQDSVAVLPELTLNLGLRLENQRHYDFRDQQIMSLVNPGLRGGIVYDPTRQGRSKVYGHYGRYYETIPLNLAARYFGGEGVLLRNYDNTGCPTPVRQWQGSGGEWNGCPLQPFNPPASFPFFVLNNGANYPVQPHLRGQYHDEIAIGSQFELMEDLVVGVDFSRRWLGAVIEDGTAVDGTFVLANPGNVPDKALAQVDQDIAAKQAEVAAAAPADKAVREAELQALQSMQANLKGLAESPKPERTYTAVTLSASKRFSRRWTMLASYTYSRLFGNYNGLYDADNDYFAPNGGNAYDTPDLVLNKKGPLANDRPHTARVTGFYGHPVGRGLLLGGLAFSAFSGVPRNHQAALFPGQQLVFLLPRGSAGRTPAVSQLDLRLSYRHAIGTNWTVEAFLDVFNVLNRRTPLRMDDDYTFDSAGAIVNGTTEDLPHAKNAAGQPVTPNANFGQATAYQAPIHGQFGLRASF